MSSEEPPRRRKAAAVGAPAYMTTFADLMALLMCFFVLLLSFSEMDLQKFKQVSGSLAQAFGVQRKTFATESPMGTSFVAREFAPGRPDPTAFKVLQQQATPERPQPPSQRRARAVVGRLKKALQNELEKELIEIKAEAAKITIRIREKGSFASGSAELQPQSRPVMARIARVLATAAGRILIAGHTDNVPVNTSRFRSNWELSSSRAVTVAHALLDEPQLTPARLSIAGHGEFRPVADNDTAEGRARNRRVEITLELNAAGESKPGAGVSSEV